MKRAFLSVLLSLAMLPACSGDSTGPSEGKFVGTYTLEAVDGGSLPARLYDETDGSIDITEGSLILRADNSHRESVTVRVKPTFGSAVTENIVEDGTYSITGNSITFSVPAQNGEAAYSYVGAVDGKVVTYTVDGTSFRYRKN